MKRINPVQFGYQDCAPSHCFGPAVRTFWLLHYVVSGKGIFTKNSRTSEVSSGEIFVIPPWVETYYEADDTDPWSYVWVGFEAEELPVVLPDVIHCPEAGAIFEDMKLCRERDNGRSAFLCTKIWELFTLLDEARPAELDYVDRALSIIHSEYMMGIGVEQIAQKLSLNRSYLYAIFKKKVGVSPAEYLFRHRMKVAAELLSSGNKTVTVTANSVGYTDIFNFSKMFKRHYGVSPNEWAKKKRNTPT